MSIDILMFSKEMKSMKDNNWISIYDALPAKGQAVITAFSDETVHADEYMPGHILSCTTWWNLKKCAWENEYANHRILYWMPMPDAPQIHPQTLSINEAINICNASFEGNHEQMLSAISTIINSGNLHEISETKVEKLLAWAIDELNHLMRGID